MKYRKKFVPVRQKVSLCIGTQPAPADCEVFMQYHMRVGSDYEGYMQVRIERHPVFVDQGYDSITEMLNDVITVTADKVKNRAELNALLNQIAVTSRRGKGNLVTIDGVNYVMYTGNNLFDAPFIRHYCNGKAKYTPHPDIVDRCVRLPRIRFVIR